MKIPSVYVITVYFINHTVSTPQFNLILAEHYRFFMKSAIKFRD